MLSQAERTSRLTDEAALAMKRSSISGYPEVSIPNTSANHGIAVQSWIAGNITNFCGTLQGRSGRAGMNRASIREGTEYGEPSKSLHLADHFGSSL